MGTTPCKYDWPEASKRKLIGKRISRVDGPAKASGRARYTYDINPPGLLYGKIVRSPYAHVRISSIDTSEAEKLPGVKAVRVIQKTGTEIQWEGDEIVGIAAVSEEIAEDAARKVKIEYAHLPVFVADADLAAAEQAQRTKVTKDDQQGDVEKAFQDPDAVISEGFYGQPVICHCCLEAHGQVTQFSDGPSLKIWQSTQGVSVNPGQYAEVLKIPAASIDLVCEYMGGGFGSKFQVDRWGIECARLSHDAAGEPVKIMLERAAELQVAGIRPSLYGKIRVAASKDGTLTAWQSESWGTGGVGGAGVPPLPYVFNIPNQKVKYTAVSTNTGGARAWRAPNHPQSAVLTMGALDDLAAKLNMDPIDFLTKNMDLAPESLRKYYLDELPIARRLAEWDKYWHPRGQGASGPVKRGLGVSLHTWGGRGHNSTCNVTIHSDGSVEVALGSQDLGVGTRTVIGIVAAESLGLPLEAVTVKLGDSRYPYSGASGGSTTVGGVSSSTRRGSVDAREALFAVVAPGLGVPPDQLEAVDGHVRVKGDPAKSLTWKQACAKLGTKPVQVMGKNPGDCNLTSSGVGGVQIADVSVDTETGIVKMNRMVAVQDCGLVIDLKTAESQVFGAMVMGITYALFEERVVDAQTGKALNANMEAYKLAGIGDIPDLVVHMMTGPGYDERGPVGLAEPPTVSPGAAISNAVANAIGVRVSTIPITPDKVLAALAGPEKGAMA
ncbi:MAG TPA: xanthine dehydrogenase family protein molybdopterin-binding subunit [Terriglobia bacterium]|jgi:xanthine dehydrogenase YagR molybdenum-binding subunit|nr:xanthine dehydrogenase family protein molybdopterin-binding subunit [Terriglobia bacterium]